MTPNAKAIHCYTPTAPSLLPLPRAKRMPAIAAFEAVAGVVLMIRRCVARYTIKLAKLTDTAQAERKPDHFGGIFTVGDEAKKKPDKEHEQKVKAILGRLRYNGIDTMVESNVEYALRKSHGDSDAAYRLLLLLQNTYQGIVEPYHPDTKLLGAINREGVTCYLDALLFAMFARLDSFEAMLYDSFNDIPRKKLAGLLRLWVNMLRTGRLITTDITAQLQGALAECGWQDAGKEDPQDDHKFVNERLLEVAIPDTPMDGSDVITLEHCLEQYFNNRIEVKRHLERRRRDTMKSINSVEGIKVEKGPATHIEVLDVTETPETPIVQSPAAEIPEEIKNPVEKLRPSAGRKRADSIFSQRKVELTGIDPEALSVVDSHGSLETPGRKMSTRTEVLMPAWQFFKLLPWYTNHLPTSDAQVASHFAKKRPMLGICLKRYSYTNEGQGRRRNTYVDIPLEIGVPDFVSDDNMEDGATLKGNFRLMLQSVVCHRGYFVHSGHYVSLCRGRAPNAQHRESQDARRSSSDSDDNEDPWMRFDDLARERVSYVDINKALREEMPYLLFYQVVPIDDDGNSVHDLPSYAEATTRSQSDAAANLAEKPYLHEPAGSENALVHETSTSLFEHNVSAARSEATNSVTAPASTRTSLDVSRALDPNPRRGRSSMAEERNPRGSSIAFDTSSFGGSTSGGSVRTDATNTSQPSTPPEEKGGLSFLAVANKLGSRRGSRGYQGTRGSSNTRVSKSRPTSVGPLGSEGFGNGNGSESRLALGMSKLTQRMSGRNDNVPLAARPSSEELVRAQVAGQGQMAEEEKVALDKNKLPPPLPTSDTAATATRPPEHSGINGRMSGQTTPRNATPLPKQLLRKDKAAAKEEKRRSKAKHREDRDCVVM
ncbi:hypothetical protein LTR59_008730 [Friedmanniomyces endolithicus]|nr:hypothetical protein LTR38_016239 [Friedmanniomyces endolithicus]KAK0791794.1 hypothetical protein LTR59_008730 [Friedmanniomyces endolithicus]